MNIRKLSESGLDFYHKHVKTAQNSRLHERGCERVSEESQVWGRKLTGWDAA